MPDHRITSLIKSVAERSAEDTAQLAAMLALGCWPRGGDRRDPVASEWLRRWSPAARHTVAPSCACAAGRCAWCN
jgi:predicted RNA polymerase sigma factor